MENKKIAKKYLNKYFKSHYIEESDLEFKSLVRILNKSSKSDFDKEIKEMMDKILTLSNYDSNHDNVLDNFGDIENTINAFKIKYDTHRRGGF